MRDCNNMSLSPKPYQKNASACIKKLLNDFRPIKTCTQDVSTQNLTLDQNKLDFLRKDKIGRLHLIDTPDLWQFNNSPIQGITARPVMHLDYTASAQTVGFIEHYMLEVMKTYGNTHTETSACGRLTTQRVKKSLETIKKHVGAGDDSFVIPAGYGATGAIEKLQSILGLYLSPRGQKILKERIGQCPKEAMQKKFVVFVGPSEHHSNDVSWQDDAMCEFVRIKAIESGAFKDQIDLDDLSKQLEAFKGYVKIGSFNAASNVTGIKNPLKKIGNLLKAHNALFLVDYAASGPYADIDMSAMGIDAIFLSGHKNLGGTNLGLLVAKNSVYDSSSSPSFGGGGTVSVVTPWEYRFHEDIEEREMAGTPAIRQIMQVSLSFELKHWVGQAKIHEVEAKYCKQFIGLFERHPNIKLLGSADPEQRYPIFSYLVTHGDRYLHHSMVAALLNDAFGIQARSGCACAGPYGHRLLNIDKALSDKYLDAIERKLEGLKPGWTRIGAHYTLSETECNFAEFALSATAFFGPLFLDDYTFDLVSGHWAHNESNGDTIDFGLSEAIALRTNEKISYNLASENDLYDQFANHILEFKQLVSFKLIQKVIDEVGIKLSLEEKIDIIKSLMPAIDELVSLKDPDILSFIEKTADCIQSNIEQKDNHFDRHKAIDCLKAALVTPQMRQDLFESFNDDINEICFFYVARGQLETKASDITKLAGSQ